MISAAESKTRPCHTSRRKSAAHFTTFDLPIVPATLSAAVLKPLGVAIHVVDLAKPRLLDPVTLLGAGPIGPPIKPRAA